MKVIGFSGPSGTGKSHRSVWVAKEKGIDYIIDDGLLIRGNTILAGISAKKEPTRLASVRHAVFQNEMQAKEIKNALKKYDPESLLILGTSDEMVEKITERLGLGKVDEMIHIEDVASDFEIQQAQISRQQNGMHVIPVPTMELKKDFSGYWLDPLRILKRKGLGRYQNVGEKSVVRPTFSYLGNYTISDYTIYQIVEYVVLSIPGIDSISRFIADNDTDGVHMELELVLVYGYNIKNALIQVKNAVVKEVENLAALNIHSINVIAGKLIVREKEAGNTEEEQELVVLNANP